jgi:membrane protein YqaA with SNARE-associated domain
MEKYKEMEHGDPKQEIAEQPLQWKSLIIKTLVLAMAILVIYGILGLLFREQLAKAGVWLGRELGYGGVAIYTFVVDAIIVPTTADVVFPFAMEWNPYILLSVMSAASILGGYLGYWIARSFNHFHYVQKVTSTYRSRGESLINRYGAWAVVIAGFTPIPFSTICWIAGLLKVLPGKVFLACLSRIPRMIVYYLLIKSGFSLIERFAG